MSNLKIRSLVLVSLLSTLAACASTSEPADEDGERAVATPDSDSEADGSGEENVGETSSAATTCALSCGFRYQYGENAYLYYCSGLCTGASFKMTYSSYRGRTFCLSRTGC